MDVYLIHGGDEVEIQNERIRIVDRLLPEDQRDENLTEFAPPGNRQLMLIALLPDLLAELGTVSFFPGAKRVAIVQNLSDFWSTPKESAAKEVAKGKKKEKPVEPVDRLIHYFETDFEGTENAVIFTVFEDSDKRIAVDARKKLVQWIHEHGRVVAFKKKDPPVWALGDAILNRDLSLALAHFRAAYKKGQPDQASAVFSSILGQVHYLLQAKIAASASARVTPGFLADELIGLDAKNNLLKIHQFRRDKYMKAARYFSIRELTQALNDLYEINKFLIPSSQDKYVPDVGFLMENLLIRLCSRIVP